MEIDLNEMVESGDLDLLAASGCASTARRICDLLAMRAMEEGEELAAANRALDMFAMGAARVSAFIKHHPSTPREDD